MQQQPGCVAVHSMLLSPFSAGTNRRCARASGPATASQASPAAQCVIALPTYLALRSAPNPRHPHSSRAASPLSWCATDEPLRHFLDDLRGLYPAFPTLLHTLLAALSATADSGEGA